MPEASSCTHTAPTLEFADDKRAWLSVTKRVFVARCIGWAGAGLAAECFPASGKEEEMKVLNRASLRPMKQLMTLLSCVTVSVTLVACGGGGSGNAPAVGPPF